MAKPHLKIGTGNLRYYEPNFVVLTGDGVLAKDLLAKDSLEKLFKAAKHVFLSAKLSCAQHTLSDLC